MLHEAASVLFELMLLVCYCASFSVVNFSAIQVTKREQYVIIGSSEILIVYSLLNLGKMWYMFD